MNIIEDAIIPGYEPSIASYINQSGDTIKEKLRIDLGLLCQKASVPNIAHNIGIILAQPFQVNIPTITKIEININGRTGDLFCFRNL